MEKKELRGLMHEVRDLLIEVEKTHRYSMSKIYGLYNKVFEKNETPQSCASCLIRKVNELREWMKKEEKAYSELDAQERENYYKSPDANTDVLGDSVNLEDKAKQEPNKTTRGKRKEA